MKKNTLEEYKKAVKAKYNLVKEDDVSGLLSNPSPGNIRELCIIAAGDKIGKDDESIFKRFFDIKDDENIIKEIENCDLDKLRPIRHYLIGRTTDPKQIIIEITAILVDFTPRPYLKFSRTEEGIPEKGNAETEAEEKELPQHDKEKKEPEKVPVILMFHDKAKANINNAWSSFSKQKKIALISVAGLFFAGYTAKDFVFPKRECMLWHEDHYVLVDCKSDEIKTSDIKPYDEEEFNRKKLKVCDTFTFFRNDEAIIWYSKKNNLVEFFNMDGKNPRNDCELKEVTQYMIDKYVPPCK